MANTPFFPVGPLALLGCEGLRPESHNLWQQLTALAPRGIAPVAILPTALAGRKLSVTEHRTRLAEETLGRLGFSPIPATILSRQQADEPACIAPLMQATSIYLMGGEPRSLYEVLAGSVAWETILARHHSGAMLIAAGGAAVVLGESIFTPLKPFPRNIDDLRFEISAGLGLLPGMVILPYFNWLPAQALEQLVTQCSSNLTLVGIDDEVALIAHKGRWEAYGSGNITLLRSGEPPHVLSASHSIPPELLSPYPMR